jgi:hypothetical protein
VVPKNGLDIMEKKKLFVPTDIRTLDHPGDSLMTVQITLYR